MTNRRRQSDDDSDLYLPADAVGTYLYHVHGIPPAFAVDFRNAEHSEFPAAWGGQTVTKNGNPVNADELGDSDVVAQDFDPATNDHFVVPSDPSLNTGGSTSLVLFMDQDTSSDFIRYFNRTTGTEGWDYLYSSNGPVIFRVSDTDGDDLDTFDPGFSPVDGEDHLLVGSYDESAERALQWVDGTDFQSESTNADFDPSKYNSGDGKDIYIGQKWSPTNWHDGAIQFVAVHSEWISGAQANYLDAILRDRTAYAPQLDRWVYGDDEGGLSRDLPDYLAPHSADLHHWWTSDRHIHQIDGEGVAQLPDYSGQNFGVQRTDASQPIVRGPSERGERASHVELSGGQSVNLRSKGTVSQWTVFGIAERGPTGSDTLMLYGLGGSGSGQIRLTSTGDGNLSFNTTDDDGVGGRFVRYNPSSGVTPRFAFVATVNFTSGRVRMVGESENGETGSETATGSFTANLVPAAGEHFVYASESETFNWNGNNSEIGTINAELTDAEQDALLDALVEKL